MNLKDIKAGLKVKQIKYIPGSYTTVGETYTLDSSNPKTATHPVRVLSSNGGAYLDAKYFLKGYFVICE